MRGVHGDAVVVGDEEQALVRAEDKFAQPVLTVARGLRIAGALVRDAGKQQWAANQIQGHQGVCVAVELLQRGKLAQCERLKRVAAAVKGIQIGTCGDVQGLQLV